MAASLWNGATANGVLKFTAAALEADLEGLQFRTVKKFSAKDLDADLVVFAPEDADVLDLVPEVTRATSVKFSDIACEDHVCPEVISECEMETIACNFLAKCNVEASVRRTFPSRPVFR